jgi:hypothetical protein
MGSKSDTKYIGFDPKYLIFDTKMIPVILLVDTCEALFKVLGSNGSISVYIIIIIIIILNI